MIEEYRIKGVYLAADTASGVYIIDPIDYPEMEILRPVDFYKSLPTLENEETIFAFFDGNDETVFDKIQAEYGIH